MKGSENMVNNQVNTKERKNLIIEKAQHIYYIGRAYVEDGIAEEVLVELDKFPGVFAEGDSQNGYTLIGKCE